MSKRFGRPALTGYENDPAAGPVRQIQLKREGRALEGAYAEAAVTGSQLDESDAMWGKKSFASTLLWWTVVCAFWIGVIWLAQNTR